MHPDPHYLTARQAAAALGVTRATLYAYTSRGQLQSAPVPGEPRERRYYREEVKRLRERKVARRDPAKAAALALDWGSPILESGITLIHEGRLYYRGFDAVKLAETASLEEVAEILWDCEAGERDWMFEQRHVLYGGELKRLAAQIKDPVVLMQAALPVAAAMDLEAYDLRRDAVRATGARILRLLVAAASGRDEAGPIEMELESGWAARKTNAAEAIRTALVLCADHELNVSAFTARCAASAAASPYDVVSAALATLRGRRHGGATERVASLFAEVDSPRNARAVIAGRLRRGENLPGFRHPLYPDGDPRAVLLLRLAEESGNQKEWRLIRSLVTAGSELLHDRPNLDFGLVALARAYRLPERAPFLLFALGRTAGWIGHAIEQYGVDRLIRPRARYTGPAPRVDTD